jgi:hypothetical protein
MLVRNGKPAYHQLYAPASAPNAAVHRWRAMNAVRDGMKSLEVLRMSTSVGDAIGRPSGRVRPASVVTRAAPSRARLHIVPLNGEVEDRLDDRLSLACAPLTSTG